jgi:hypothetical protein
VISVRKLLAIALISGALIVSASAVFADEHASGAASIDQNGPSGGGYWVDPQGMLLVADTQSQ